MTRRGLLAVLVALAVRPASACSWRGAGKPVRTRIRELRRQDGIWIVASRRTGELPLIMDEMRLHPALRELEWALEHGLERILYVHDGAVVAIGIPDVRC